MIAPAGACANLATCGDLDKNAAILQKEPVALPFVPARSNLPCGAQQKFSAAVLRRIGGRIQEEQQLKRHATG